MTKRIFYATLATLFLATGTVYAGNTFETLDTDKSGGICQNEAKAMPELTQQFAQLDLNKDGKLDMDEFGTFEVTK
ncbi:MAG: hypothetical protein U9R66_01430 [Thermodesulfobacteriota bacterium]|jgi:hypothetical protein|nr:hypothetical protein [Thermodesulfobacteriota bacterium]